MIREIKFRAWDRERNIMIGSDYPNNWGNNIDEWWGDEHKMMITGIEDVQKMTSLALMQYTGLKDKNEKDIYESDIVTIKGEGLRNKHSEVVIFKEGKFRTKNIFDNLLHCEVIGNIYENEGLIDA